MLISENEPLSLTRRLIYELRAYNVKKPIKKNDGLCMCYPRLNDIWKLLQFSLRLAVMLDNMD